MGLESINPQNNNNLPPLDSAKYLHHDKSQEGLGPRGRVIEEVRKKLLDRVLQNFPSLNVNKEMKEDNKAKVIQIINEEVDTDEITQAIGNELEMAASTNADMEKAEENIAREKTNQIFNTVEKKVSQELKEKHSN